MKRRLLCPSQLWSFTWLLALVFSAYSLSAKEKTSFPESVKSYRSAGTPAPPMFVNPPGDTTIIGVCNVPQPAQLLVDDPEDGQWMVFPIDSTDNGMVEACVLDTLFRIWRATDSEMITITHIQKIIIQPMPAPNATFIGSLDTISDCKFAFLNYNAWKTSVTLKIGTNLSECATADFTVFCFSVRSSISSQKRAPGSRSMRRAMRSITSMHFTG